MTDAENLSEDQHDLLSSKTESSNIIINDVLCFITTAVHSKPSEFMVNAALAYYDAQSVREAKNLLFSYSNEKCIRRRGEDSKKNDILDIIELVKKLHEDDINIPDFTARKFDSMPPACGYEIIASNIVDLIEEIKLLRSEVTSLKESNCKKRFNEDMLICLQEDVTDIKQSIANLGNDFSSVLVSNDLKKQSPYNMSLNISPLLPSSQSKVKDLRKKFLSDAETPKTSLFQNKKNNNIDVHSNCNNTTKPSAPPMSQEFINSYYHSSEGDQVSTVELLSDSSRPKTNSPLKSVQNVLQNNSEQYIKSTNLSEAVAEINTVDTSSSNNSNLYSWKLINGKKRSLKPNVKSNKSNYVIGNRVSENTFKGAKKHLDLFLGNVDIDSDCDMIRNYINSEFKVNVIDCSEIKVTKYSKSFKISVLAVERDMLLNPDFWPTGVTCRKFFNYNKKSSWYNSKL